MIVTKRWAIGILIVILVVVAMVAGKFLSSSGTKVLLKTNMGDIVIEMYDKERPITAGNFEKLVSEGLYLNACRGKSLID